MGGRARLPVIKPVTDTRRKCGVCNSKFTKDTAHWFVVYYSVNKRHRSVYHFECWIHSNHWNPKNKTPSCSSELEGFEMLTRSKQTEIVKLLWPQQIDKHLRARLNITKFIDAMSEEELRIELEKRDISQSVHYLLAAIKKCRVI